MSYFRIISIKANERTFTFVGEGGLEPPNSEEDRFTVCCNCRYATLPSNSEPIEGFEPPTRWLQISCSGQLSYIGIWLFLYSNFQISLSPILLPNASQSSASLNKSFPKCVCKDMALSQIYQIFSSFFLIWFCNILILSSKKNQGTIFISFKIQAPRLLFKPKSSPKTTFESN